MTFPIVNKNYLMASLSPEAEAEATHARRMLPVKESGPLEWLPQSAECTCQYESRLWRVALIYGLVVDETEAKAMQQQRAIVCADG